MLHALLSNGAWEIIFYVTIEVLIRYRDTDDSAPAQYPPDQPEADVGIDDGLNYGAEEVELEEGLKAELAQLPADEDEEMDGAADTSGAKADDDESDAGSEDLEAESSGSEDEEEEAEDGDEEMDMVSCKSTPDQSVLCARQMPFECMFESDQGWGANKSSTG